MSRVKQFELPDLGEGLTEGEILKWFVGKGDEVTLNQPIVEVETAKAAVEIPSPYAGVITELHHSEGETVDVGAIIVTFDTDPSAGPLPAPGETPAASGQGEESTAVLVGRGAKEASTKRRARRSAADVQSSVPSPPPQAPPAPAAPPAPPAPEPAPANGRSVLAKPPVRKLAKDLGVDLSTLQPSGPRGSISRDDVLTAHAAATEAPAAPTAAAGPARPVFGPDREQRIPIKGVRKLTAENMVASAFTAPHVTEFLTVDATRTMEAVERLKVMRDWRDVRVSPLLLVAKAVLLGIRRHPMINSSWDADRGEIVVKEYVNLGIAAATGRGLIVPNVADAGRLSMRELADAMTDLVETAKAGKTAPAAMQGGTFTITNVGVFGVDTGTPILPPGEAAILAFGAVRQQPWVYEGQVVPRWVTTLGMSFDHRIVDGELGSRFLADVGQFLTDPEATLLAWD